MYAITIKTPGGPEQLQWSTTGDPAVGPGEVLVDVVAAGVNRADLLQRQGHYPPPPGASTLLGLECSGHVAALGEAVRGWEVGQSCVALLAGGGYAERVAVPAGQLLPVPAGVEFVTAAGLPEVAATVVSNVDLADVHPGDWVLVHGGAGGLGSFAVQYLRALGVRVITTAGSNAKLDYCRELGADVAIDYHTDWAAGVDETTEGRGVAAILDVMGAKYLDANLDCLAPDGRLMIIGMQGGRRAQIDLGALVARRAAIFATSLRSRPAEQKAAICARVREVVWPMIADGSIRPARTTTFPLPDAAQAHERLDSGQNLGKIVLVRQ